MKRILIGKILIYRFEDHFYLYGQIGFLFRLGTIDSYSKVKEYGDKICGLLDKYYTDKEFKLQRALLTKGFYFGKRQHNHTFCVWSHSDARDRNENWRTVFNNEERDDVIKELLEDKREIDTIIDTSTIKNWRRYFVNDFEIMNDSSTGLIRKLSDDDIRILRTTSIGGAQSELRSLAFYFQYIKPEEVEVEPFKTKDYFPVSSQKELPAVFLNNWYFNQNRYFLDIRFFKTEFELRMGIRDQDKNVRSFDRDLLLVLETHGFKEQPDRFQDNSLFKYLATEEETNNILRGLLQEFSEIKKEVFV